MICLYELIVTKNAFPQTLQLKPLAVNSWIKAKVVTFKEKHSDQLTM